MAQNEFKYTVSVEDLDSTAVSDLFYDDETGQIAVSLNNGGAYVYQGRTFEDFRSFFGARSVGHFYSTYVKNRWSRNSQYEPSEVYFVRRVYSDTAKSVPTKTVNETTKTSVVLAVNGNITIQLDGDVSAEEALASFLTAFSVADAQVVSRTVTKTETLV